MLYLTSSKFREPFFFLRKKLNSEIYASCGIEVKFLESPDYAYTQVDCYVKSKDSKGKIIDRQIDSLVLSYLGNILTEAILIYWEPIILSKMINANYNYLRSKEKREISEKVFERLKMQEPCGFPKAVYDRRSQIYNTVLEYLRENGRINIEGFLNFRLRFYWDALENVVNQTADGILWAKEYDDFICLLKYFLESQEPRIKKVHVILLNTGFQLYDSDDNIVAGDSLEEYVAGFEEEEIDSGDLLISALVAIAPQEVVLHLSTEVDLQEAVDILKNVFGKRMVICSGCSRCISVT